MTHAEVLGTLLAACVAQEIQTARLERLKCEAQTVGDAPNARFFASQADRSRGLAATLSTELEAWQEATRCAS